MIVLATFFFALLMVMPVIVHILFIIIITVTLLTLLCSGAFISFALSCSVIIAQSSSLMILLSIVSAIFLTVIIHHFKMGKITLQDIQKRLCKVRVCDAAAATGFDNSSICRIKTGQNSYLLQKYINLINYLYYE